MFNLPYNWRPSTIWYNIGLYYGLKNLFRWFPIIWRDRDWDWQYLAKVMEFKLRNMSYLEKTYGHHTTSLRDSKQQLICAELLKRLQEDNYWDNAKIRFGENTFAANHSARVQIADQKYLGLLIGKYLNHWWD